MTAFNADNFRGKLSRLSESSQSIQTLSGWIQYHKKHAVESAEVWAKETLVADPERQLLYIYLANDVMQHSRRKKTEQVKTFGGHMKAVLPAAYAAAPESVRSKLLRMLSIWEERQILSTPEISAMRAAVSGGGAPPAVMNSQCIGSLPWKHGGVDGFLPPFQYQTPSRRLTSSPSLWHIPSQQPPFH